jgi:cell division control protein 11
MSSFLSDSSILPEELATQSVRLKEEQLRREEEKVLLSITWARG